MASLSSNSTSSRTDSVAAATTALDGLALGAAAPPDATAVQASHLPFEVVVRVMQQVSQQQRLTVCTRVCSTWAAAAVAASSTVQLSLANATAAARHERAAGLGKWLQQNATHVRDLQLDGNYMSRPRLQLPVDSLQQLQHLRLANCRACFAVAPTLSSKRTTAASSRPSATPQTCSKCSMAPAGSDMQQDTAGPGSSTIDGPFAQQQQQQQQQQQRTHSNRSSTRSSPSASSSYTCTCYTAPQAALVSLQLQGCVLEWGSGLPAAVSLHNLQQLSLQQLLPGELSKEQQQTLQQIIPAAFKQMTQLTRLVLKQLNQYESLVVAGLAVGLGGMQQLQQLEMDMLRLTTAALVDIPSRITKLELAGAKTVTFSSSALPNLTKLTGLQELFIEGVGKFEPRLLSGMQGLKSLRVRSSSSRFLPDGFLGTQDLLAALRGLTQLQTLDLRNILQHLQAEEQAQLYSGLTASSVLQQLDLSACRFPPNCEQFVLSSACCWPQLRRLVLYRCEDPPGSVLQLSNLDSLVECCPALQDLALWVSPPSNSTTSGQVSSSSSGSSSSSSSGTRERHAGLQLHPLLHLTALTRLVVAGRGVTCGELSVLAQLRQLSSLAMYRCSPLTDTALLGLTHLTQLTSLAVDAHSCITSWPGVSEYLYIQGATSASSSQDSPAGFANFQAAKALDHSASGRVLTLPRAREAFVKARLSAPVWQQLQRLLLTGSFFGDVSEPSRTYRRSDVAATFELNATMQSLVPTGRRVVRDP